MRLIDAIGLKQSLAISSILADEKTLEQIIDEQPTIEERKTGRWIHDLTIHCESQEEQDNVLKKLNSMNWIPCTERLPEYGVGVLTFNRDDEYEVNHIIDEEDGEWFFDGVIAWMPLPEPYHEVEHDG